MRWYFAIDEAGAQGQTSEDAKTALQSALAVGGLEPCLIYHGARNDFTGWMEQHGAIIIDAQSGFLDNIQQAEAAGTFRAHSIGHWLRLAIPQIENERQFVLYTDCDVVFLKPINWAAIQPKVMAVAPEFRPDNWNYFNAGVMVLNVSAMRASYELFAAHIRGRILDGRWPSYDDQWALNEVYKGFWDRLDIRLNWKPYWGYDSTAGILHFHGPKLSAIEAIAAGQWQFSNPAAIQFGKMLDGHIDGYIAWLRVLGDTMQAADMKLALRLQNAASALLRRRATITTPVDTSFMNFRMFSDG